MNISNNLNGVMMTQMQNTAQNQNTLSEAQLAEVNDILSQYDADNLSQDDFENLFQQFKDAGIPMGESLKAATEEAGFDFSANLEVAMQTGSMPPPPGGMPPPPPSESAEATEDEEENEYSAQLSELLAAYENGEADQSDFEALIESIKASSTSATGNLINQVA